MKKHCFSCSYYDEITTEVGQCSALGVIQENGVSVLDAVNIFMELKHECLIHTPLLVQGRFGCMCHSNKKYETL